MSSKYDGILQKMRESAYVDSLILSRSDQELYKYRIFRRVRDLEETHYALSHFSSFGKNVRACVCAHSKKSIEGTRILKKENSLELEVSK